MQHEESRVFARTIWEARVVGGISARFGAKNALCFVEAVVVVGIGTRLVRSLGDTRSCAPRCRTETEPWMSTAVPSSQNVERRIEAGEDRVGDAAQGPRSRKEPRTARRSSPRLARTGSRCRSVARCGARSGSEFGSLSPSRAFPPFWGLRALLEYEGAAAARGSPGPSRSRRLRRAGR